MLKKSYICMWQNLSEFYLDKFIECLKFNFLYDVSMETIEYFIITIISTGETSDDLSGTMIAHLAFAPLS